jgi:hypothetical protein
MSAKVLTPVQANLELLLLSSEAEAFSNGDIYAWLKDMGLPNEVAIRLKDFSEITADVGKRVIHVGKLILIKMIAFVKAHPKLAVGIAIGAAIGSLVSAIPWIGLFLAPIATMLGVAVGALAGHRLDKSAAAQTQNDGRIAIAQDLIEIANDFFNLLIDIFKLTMSEATIKGN